MRFEKLNENKIRIIFNNIDLEQNNVDLHSFMADPIESQSVFFDMLNEAEKQIGFITENYNIKLEAIQVSGGNFILTVTRSLPDSLVTNQQNRKIHIRRKKPELDKSVIIYCFNAFDDFCSFSNFLKNNNLNIENISKNISLYNYNNNYYLVFTEFNTKYENFKKLFSCITEFATYTSNAELFKRNLMEKGKNIMKHNAIKTAIQYFS